MPKDRAIIDLDRLRGVVSDIATGLGDGQPHQSGEGFANAVYIGDTYVYKLVPLATDGTPEYPKERHVLAVLAQSLAVGSRGYVPELVYTTPQIGGLGCVDVYTRLPGAPPAGLSSAVCRDLGRFLADLHDCPAPHLVTEFDDEPAGPSFRDYAAESAEKYATKLRTVVADTDLLELVERATTTVGKLVADLDEPDLVILHKDLFGGNILTAGDHLTGVIDWEAAQTGPREWEFTILRQRFPAQVHSVYDGYGHHLDETLLDLCGLVQSLRFWKSFPRRPGFVAQQVDYIRRILGEPP